MILFQMKFLLVLSLLLAGVFAAPLDYNDVESDFTPQKGTEDTVEPAHEEPVVETPEANPESGETPVEHKDEATEAPEAPDVAAPEDAETTDAPESEPENTDDTEADETESPAENTEDGAETEPENDDEGNDAVTETESPVENADEDAEAEAEPVEQSEGEAADDEKDASSEVEDEPTTTVAPVEAEPIKNGAQAVVDGVTVRFALKSIWLTDDNEQRRGYTVKIANKSDKEVCGVTFAADKLTDVWNLAENEDGSFTTRDLRLAPGQQANQFGYSSAGRTHPVVTAVTYC